MVVGDSLVVFTGVSGSGKSSLAFGTLYAEAQRRYLLRQVPFVIWGQGLACGSQQALPASHRDMFSTLLPLAGVDGPYVNAGRNLLKTVGDKPGPIDAARAMFFTGEARNAQGMWQLGQPNTFVCTSANPSVQNCQFNAQDDQQERARYGLLDWNVRINLRKP